VALLPALGQINQNEKQNNNGKKEKKFTFSAGWQISVISK
jgi:hypothetical protein